RTGAATALAARHLARPDSAVATVCGCGAQGRIQLTALKHGLPLERAYAYDIDPAIASTFAGAMSASLDIPVTRVATVREATIQSDVIVTCSTSRQPFLSRADVAPGTFVPPWAPTIRTSKSSTHSCWSATPSSSICASNAHSAASSITPSGRG